MLEIKEWCAKQGEPCFKE
ncbi:hypothetical protein NB515_09715 [Vibrio alginolyticus]|nr:hypothetical protein [Vibrio alginolyticus]